MTRREADEPRDREPSEAPEREAAEEALLLGDWAQSLEAAEDLPEEVLGLLDGTLQGSEAARVRRRLAEDPALAKAAGELVASRRGIDPAAGTPVPGPLMTEALDLVPPVAPRHEQAGFPTRLVDWMRAAAAPGLAAAVAGALLVTFVVLERDPRAPTDATVRAGAEAPSAIVLESPASDGNVTGALDLRWQSLPGAVRYRVVLVDTVTGDVTDAGHTEGPQLTVPTERMIERFGEGPRPVHWIVRARLLDGTEVSSEPRRVHWSAR